ncbi:MAG: hypothetical protein H0W78_18600 [Planctomycetes bacterium]|nr:hypothetical protein [Planctomycetota bacterium]
MPSFVKSVHVRTLVVLLAVMAAMLISLGAWAHQLLRQSFERLEAAEANEEMQAALQCFDDRCVALTTAAVAWSDWSSGMREVELSLPVLPGDASLVFEMHFAGPAPDIGRMALSDAAPLSDLPGLLAAVLHHDPTQQLGTTGRALVPLAGGRMLVVWSNRVLPHGVVGAVVAGRWLDERWLDGFADEIRHQVRLRTAQEIAPGDAVERVLDGSRGVVLQAADDGELLAHGRIDLHGGPLVMSVSLDRGIVAAGDLTWDILMIAIAITGGILVVAVLLLLERTVLGRVTSLGRHLGVITQTNDHVSLVAQRGGDEISGLGVEINRLLASQRGWREQISRRNASMRLIFDTLPVGLLTLDPQGRIQPDRSIATSELLGRHDLDGVHFGELLAPGPSGAILRGRLADHLQLVRSGTIQPEELDEVNPLKIVTVQRTNGPMVLRLHFYSIEHGSGTTRRFKRETGSLPASSGVLVTLTDISDERRLAAEVERSHADYEQLKAMAEDVELFHGFLARLRTMVRQLSDLSARMGEVSDRVLLTDLQRGVRALRSGGATFGLADVERLTHTFDAELTRYLGMPHLGDLEIRRCRYGVADLEAAVIAIERQFRALLGGEEPTSGAAVAFAQRAQPVRSREEQLVAKRAVLAQLSGLLVQPARTALAPTTRLIQPMTRRRGVEVRFTMQGEEVPIDEAHLDVLNHVLPHLLRFACDHGFDAAEVRAAAGKPAAPLLTLMIERHDRALVITVADDGGGIDPHRMRTLAVEQGLMTAEAAAALDDQGAQGLVFRLDYDAGDPSLSGARQVGFNLIVKRLHEELHADVAVQSVPGQGTVVTISIPLSTL